MKEWLNIDTGEFKNLEDGVVIKGINWVEVPEGTIKITKDGGGTITFWSSDTVSMNLGDSDWEDSDNGDVMDFNEYCSYSFEVVWEREEETFNPTNRNEFNPLVPQEGGDHYKLRPIQPIEYSERNGLSMSQGNIVKYITRHKEKNGVEDLAKVVHYALLEAYFVYDVKGSTELKQRILKMLGD